MLLHLHDHLWFKKTKQKEAMLTQNTRVVLLISQMVSGFLKRVKLSIVSGIVASDYKD